MIQVGEQFRSYLENALDTQLSDRAVFFGVFKRNGEGVVAIDNYTQYDAEIFYAGRQLISRGLLAVVFNYIFKELNCHRCTSRITADNDKAISIVERLGFKHEGVLRQAINGQDVIIHGLLKSECRYINDGQKIATQSARPSRSNGNDQAASSIQQNQFI